ncbi:MULTISPECIES: hypothetical protein [Peribacillus]|uniref:hypothetical protein n=1 Tax=Peribacillus TaxID=2675229 RepID=UPI000BA78824|nr:MULTISPECIES: hypothetical protein [Peribacillus]MBD8591434.1 hypothetical protein [Peribacillus simplex]MCM3169630.1 hypothetical protein [Peribacillus frigoritolerans]MEE3955770.1 hypothetical protein [Peribacillus frigoritolerans]PAL04626.1 hypothetical protein B8W99_26735 [Peribacillus simplex]
MKELESQLEKYNQIKIDLLKVAKCIECCSDNERELYQNISLEYSKELRGIKQSIEDVYGIQLCACCSPKLMT